MLDPVFSGRSAVISPLDRQAVALKDFPSAEIDIEESDESRELGCFIPPREAYPWHQVVGLHWAATIEETY